MNVGIIGYGVIGQEVGNLFPNAKIYSPSTYFGSKEEFNKNLDIAFICVPTPQLKNGKCDTSIVEESVIWAKPKLFICLSTVEIGTTERLVKQYKKRIVFQPEYFGETVAHPLSNLGKQPFLILGGRKKSRARAIELYQTVYNSNVKIFQTDSRTAEVIKYMENSWLATKVTFMNEFYDLCNQFGVSYNEVREGFLLDPRVTRSHTFVYPKKRGWSGKCLPKDTASLCHQAKGKAKLIEAVRRINDVQRR